MQFTFFLVLPSTAILIEILWGKRGARDHVAGHTSLSSVSSEIGGASRAPKGAFPISYEGFFLKAFVSRGIFAMSQVSGWVEIFMQILVCIAFDFFDFGKLEFAYDFCSIRKQQGESPDGRLIFYRKRQNCFSEIWRACHCTTWGWRSFAPAK